ncbi:Transmembrane 9 superfamily member 4 [Cichlidogyrus casuarinus]|uniref:Transmembrane 9 superfamily member n=1 Tax=Cichlidogyrus casuarinus TaxID=1844966 RepID=A0ABD2Q8N0_9PLAT
MHAIFFYFASFLLLSLQESAAIYVPGITPTEFSQNDPVEIDALKLFSSKTQLPFDYYTLRFCEPKEQVRYEPENIGSILRGDRMVNTPYEVKMGVNSACNILCELSYSAKKAERLQQFIKDGYFAYLSADDLPSASRFVAANSNKPHFTHGYPIGYMDDGKAFIHNHLIFQMKHHNVGNGKYRLVGFEIIPQSIANSQIVNYNKDKKTCSGVKRGTGQKQELKSDYVLFTYEVVWAESEIKWASRWDIFLSSENTQIHWLSILNSLLIIVFLSGAVAMILLRALKKDIAKYNRDEEAEDILEETGWKLVHGDVFRPPRFPRLLVVILGSGVQIFLMVFVVICEYIFMLIIFSSFVHAGNGITCV